MISKLIKNNKILILIALSLLVVVELILLIKPDVNLFGSNVSLEEYATNVMTECSESDYAIGCYDREIPELMKYISMEKAFEVAALIQERDPQYGYCHVLGHNLSARETSKDISKWKDVITRCPQGICSNGCLHGAAQERFRNDVLDSDQIEYLKTELTGVCDDTNDQTLTGLERAECYHGLGHLTMYVTGADMNESAKICDKIAVDRTGEEYTSLCYEGLFMQLFQPLDTEDEVLVEGLGPQSVDEARPFCESFGNIDVVEACWSQVHPLYGPELSTPEGILKYCNQTSSEEAKIHCYSMSFWGEAQGTNYNQVELAALCEGMPEDIKGLCFGNMSNATIHGGFKNIEIAVGLCAKAISSNTTNGCYERILERATYNVPIKTDDFLRLCNSFPDGYKKRCLDLNR
jgi:hypothetical protein